MSDRHKIGEVAERTGLSLRTIRYYEEVGLVEPTARTEGGFRLFTDADVARLEAVMGMKPLGFSLDEMRELVDLLEAPAGSEQRARLGEFHARAAEKVALLRRKLASAEALTADLGHRLGSGQG